LRRSLRWLGRRCFWKNIDGGRKGSSICLFREFDGTFAGERTLHRQQLRVQRRLLPVLALVATAWLGVGWLTSLEDRLTLQPLKRHHSILSPWMAIKSI